MNRQLFETLLGEPVSGTSNGLPILASGLPLTAAQERAIAPILADGIPEWHDDASYQAACIAERKRRNRVIVPDGDDALLLMQAVADCHAAIKSIAAGDTAARDAAIARNDALLASVPGVAANNAAYTTVVALTGTDRPADYLSLVNAFDAALA